MKIIFKKEVVFTDMNDSVIKTYRIGDVVDYTAKTETYFITSTGGIYFDEAEEFYNQIADNNRDC